MSRKLSFLALVLLSISSVKAAVVWNWDGTVLLGAQNVDVNGTLYDVRFLDGTCIDLFSGCNDLSDFTFNSVTEAISAAQSLKDQVFIEPNDVTQPLDSSPGLTNGCNLSPVTTCTMFTPYGLSNSAGTDFVHASGFLNNNAGTNTVGGYALVTSNNLTDRFFYTYAIWSKPNSVPIPAALWLFGTALISFIGMSKRT